MTDGTDSAIRALYDIVIHHRYSKEMRVEAVISLGRYVSQKEAVTILRDIAANHKYDDEIRIAATRALGGRS